MKLIASDNQMRQMTVNGGKVYKRGADGTFTVPDSIGISLKKGSEFGVVGTNFRSTRGWRCVSCGRVNVIRDHCGRCGGTELVAED
jgi:hypothetical protein